MRWAMVLAMALAFGCGEEKKSAIQEKTSEIQEKKSEIQVKTSECRTGGETLCKKHHEVGTKVFESCVTRYINNACATDRTDS